MFVKKKEVNNLEQYIVYIYTYICVCGEISFHQFYLQQDYTYMESLTEVMDQLSMTVLS